jgi:hypothetical protein
VADPAERRGRTRHWRVRPKEGEDIRRAGAAWIGGVVLIALGGLLLLQQLGVWRFGPHGWALLILVPALGGVATAARLYRHAGQTATPAVMGSATGAAILAFIAVMLLFDLSWSLLWPMFLIIPGVVGLFGSTGADRQCL